MRLKVKHFLYFCVLLPPWLGWVGYRIVTLPEALPAAEWAPLAPELWSEGGFTDFDEKAVLKWVDQDIGEAAHVDVIPEAIWRMDVRQFLGDTAVTSVRVDLDRDTFFDAQFYFGDDEKVTLEWSSDDNEAYDQYLLWTGKGWVATVRPAKPGEARTDVAPAVAAVLAWKGRSPTADQGMDVTPETAWRIDLVHSGGTITQVMLDSDRDGMFDQRWDFTSDPMGVQVYPTDDGLTDSPYIWNGSRLTPAP